MNDTATSKVPLILAIVALVGVVLLSLLVLSQRGTIRELRAMILNDRANAALGANAGAEAEALLAEVHEIQPDTPALWRRRAIARMMAGQNFEAITAAREHLRDNPGDVAVSALLGAAQIMTRDYDGADQTLTSALQIAPLQRDLVQNLSELRRLQKRPADAAALIDQYLAQNPDDGFFQYKRAMAEVAGDLSDDRRRNVAEVIASGNPSAGVLVVAAAIDLRDGKPNEALEKLQIANMVASAQDMRTMLEDEFFSDHLRFGPNGEVEIPTATGAPAMPAPAAAPASVEGGSLFDSAP